ncbi:MAG: primosomal protein N' (replication factor Y), partial [Mariniblastus sp.]
TQVAGRTGRGEKGGRVLVQTFNPENKAIQAATRHDYLGFAATEMPEREEYNYPPFGFQARIVVRGEIQSKAEQMADHIADEIQSASEILASDVAVLGPAPAPVEKLRGKFRFHMLLSSGTPGELQNVIRRAQTTIKSIDDVQWIVDIDPQDMM